MPRKAKTSSPKKTKQQTLTGFLQSSPAKGSATPRNHRKRAAKPITRESSSESDGSADSHVRTIAFESRVISLSDEEESPRRPTLKRRRQDTCSTEGSVVDDDSNEVPIRSKLKKGKSFQILDSDEEDIPRRSKFVKGTRPSTPEVEDIGAEVDGNDILESRLRTRGKKSTFQKNLEKLKRKKRGRLASESSESFSSENEESDPAPFQGAKPHQSDDDNSSRLGDEDDEDNFIVKDDEKGPQATQLPVAFSMNTHQDLTHQFKIVCQLFVHMAVRPRYERRTFMEQMIRMEEYFSVPLQVTRRKLFGVRDSVVTSSVWRPSFKQPMERYPKFELVQLDTSVPSCDACNLGGRVSTLLGRVSGTPYNPLDFEPDDSDVESSDWDSDEENRNPCKEFHLGRFCAARTKVFHAFNHWEYSLYHALLYEIDELRDENRSFVRIAYSGGVKPPKNLQDADGIMDWLDQRGVIEFEWQRIRQMMESAQNLGRRTDDAAEM
ncbi:hypothetical protein BJ138DRAFT_1143392 [Hygrophoropsis aurantiaca]|uniref:Uncharacterized protein n=1 Tax=Hygrophoropsis aurantiaca TaxID=72124 RepID=A0ACB8AN46_9AGAM|nr:hypothetical protein BJ138DRAFT_1143392 [Hygrophoropsis aurantiaca]